MQIRLFKWLRRSQDRGVKDRTLTKVSLYLDSVLVDRDRLTRDESALVAGLLEGHKVFFWQEQQPTQSASREGTASPFGNLAWKPRGYMSSTAYRRCQQIGIGVNLDTDSTMAEQKLRIPLSSLGHKLVQDLPYSRPATPGLHAQVQVGWIGLGAMGYLMARNLATHRATHLENQPPLLVWNRSKEKSEKLLRELGDRKVAIAQTVVDIATKCDIVLTSLSSDDVIKSVYKELAATMQARSSHTGP